MDPVTHTLLGVAIGEAFFRPRLGRRAVTISAWAANLPDIDALVLLTGDPGSVILRRSFGHSLLLLPLWIAAATWLCKKKYVDIENGDIAMIVAVGCAGHLGFDLINSFGVQLLWPFSHMRPELATIFIIDLALAAFLAAPHLTRLRAAWRPGLTTACRTSLVAVVFYLAMAFSARTIAGAVLASEVGPGSFQYVFPEPLGAHRWRGVVKDDGAWRMYLIDVPRRAAELRMTVLNDEFSSPVYASRQSPFGRRLETFFKAPVWEAVPQDGGGSTVHVRDLRFSSLVLPRADPFTYMFDIPRGSAEAKARGVRIW